MILPLDFLSDQAVLAAIQHHPAQLARFVFKPPPMKPKDGEREQDPQSSQAEAKWDIYCTQLISICVCVSVSSKPYIH